MIRDERTLLTEEQAHAAGLSQDEYDLHTHYASNAIANGHAADCRTVTEPRNWPRLFGSWPIPCTCGVSEANAKAFQEGTRHVH